MFSQLLLLHKIRALTENLLQPPTRPGSDQNENFTTAKVCAPVFYIKWTRRILEFVLTQKIWPAQLFGGSLQPRSFVNWCRDEKTGSFTVCAFKF